MKAAALNVEYVVLDAIGCPRVAYDLSPSGFYNRRTSMSYETLQIPIDPLTALRLKLATPYELGFSDAFVSTLSLLDKP